MLLQRSHLLWAAVALLGACAVARCERDYDDKPYKFGFNIEKHHHRLEEKDTKGLIKGEFGFVTGDGVYHETAYATDEAGDFKILGMRSYFVGLPGLDLPDITKGSKPTPPKAAPVVPAAPASMPLQPLDLSGIMGCSGCTIPTGPSKPLSVGVTSSGGSGDPLGRPAAAFGGVAGGSDPFSRPPSAFGGPGGPSPTGHRFQQGGSGSGGSPQPPPYTPTTSSASNIKVGGFTAEDMKALLYRFNYTLGFHGHHEVGDRAGHKKGDYHFNGRDGFERAVQYTANELGYQPNITLRELGADSRATPRQDTEKGAEFGLKGFEFVWFNPQQNAGRAARALQGNRHINRPGGRLQR